jgi:hypothetical protein
MREFQGGAALVGARLPPVELQQWPESVVCPPLGPAEAHGVGAVLLRLLHVYVAAATRRATAAYLIPATADCGASGHGGGEHGADLCAAPLKHAAGGEQLRR